MKEPTAPPLIVSFFVLLLLLDCSFAGDTKPKKPQQLRSKAEVYLSEAQLRVLKPKSLRGDIAATQMLAIHYGQYLRDQVTAQKYWLRGAKAGDPTCMHNYAVGQMMHIALPALEEAEEWAAKAADRGERFSPGVRDAATRALRALTE